MSAMTTLDEVREHHRKYLNLMFRRPGMYGPVETAEHLLLEMVAAAEGRLDRWRAELETLRCSDEFTAIGVKGAYGRRLPDGSVRHAVTSRYAEIAHRLGCLDRDRTHSPAEHQAMRDGIADWVAVDRTEAEVLETFGEPSIRIGGRTATWARTVGYTTADPADDLICF